MLLIATALREEFRHLRLTGCPEGPTRQVGRWPVRTWHSAHTDIGAVAAGVGTDAMREALIAVDAACDVSGVIIAGTCGALTQTSPVGEVALADQIVGEGYDPICPHTEDVAHAESALDSLNPVRGRLATVPHVACNPEVRRELAETTGAQWADMESVAAAHLAARFAVPWVCLRVVSDAAGDDLNQSFTARGIQAVLSPGALGSALRLRRQSRQACRRLGEALSALVPALLSR